MDGGFHTLPALGTVVISVAGGSAIGIVLGYASHVLIARIDELITEMTVSVAAAYGAFLAAESLHLSGVLATIAATITLGHLGRQHGWVYSQNSEQMLTDLWELLAAGRP